MKYNHMLDIAFSVETAEADPHKISEAEIISALLGRIASLVNEGQGQLNDATGHCDTYIAKEDK